MELNGKTYKVIFWDWLWTLYSPLKSDVYSWVGPYFDKFGSDTENYIISFADNPEKRRKLIEEYGVGKWCRDIMTETYNDGKLGVFQSLIDKYGLNKEDILVVGDNVKEEIRAARILDLAYMPIADWNEFVRSKLW